MIWIMKDVVLVEYNKKIGGKKQKIYILMKRSLANELSQLPTENDSTRHISVFLCVCLHAFLACL